MLTREGALAAETAQFGRFVLQPTLRRLEKDGVPVDLGGRALDILIVLVERVGEIVSHQELQERVWKNVTVEQSSLRVQVRALRRALGESEDGGQYILNIAGRGYSFVAPVLRASTNQASWAVDAEFALPRLKPLVGRDQAVRNIIAQLVEKRFVTIVGTGGVGKTAAAIAAAHGLIPAFSGAVCFLDLSEMTSAHAVHVLLGRAALQRLVVAEGAVRGLVEFLQDRRVLIVLDCCDNIAGAAGEIAAALMQHTRDVHVLATSRECLGDEREAVITLPPLAFPADADSVPIGALNAYAAVRLLTDLVRRQCAQAQLGDADLLAIAKIAGQLDGLPLALELAAASIIQNGVARTTSMIASRLALFMTDPVATIPRHASMSATLEWSYAQLTTDQRVIFRNLAVFAGPFTMDGIHNVATDADMDAHTVNAAVSALLAKSLIYQEVGAETLRYRLLDTARAFGNSKLLTFGDTERVRQRHASYITQCLTRAHAAARELYRERVPEWLTCNIHNIRVALEWCFSTHGDATLGARLAAAAAQVFNSVNHHAEIQGWLAQALFKLDKEWIGTRLELDIRFGMLVTSFELSDFYQAFLQLPAVIELADTCGGPIWRAEARAWECMMMAQQRPVNTTIECARIIRDIASSIDDYPTRLLGDWLLGLAYHLRGDLHQVDPLCSSATTLAFSTESVYFSRAQVNAQIGAIGSLARTLWLQGQPEAALRIARAAVAKFAGNIGDRQTLRVFFVPLFIWSGAISDAEDLLATVHAESGRGLDQAFAQMYLGALELRAGNTEQAVQTLLEAYDNIQTVSMQGIVATDLAEGLALLGRYLEAKCAIGWAFEAGEKSGETFFFPELYRVMGVVMTLAPATEAPDADSWFQRAIDCANRQGSLGFALRAATSLARFHRARGSAAQARAVLAETYDRFTEGFDTPDLVAARDLLDTLEQAVCAPAVLA